MSFDKRRSAIVVLDIMCSFQSSRVCRKFFSIFGGYKAVVRPDPIPNSAVKHHIADGSACVRSVEMPDQNPLAPPLPPPAEGLPPEPPDDDEPEAPLASLAGKSTANVRRSRRPMRRNDPSQLYARS